MIAQPIADDITPNVAAGNVCAGQSLSATFAGASGGTGTVTDVHEFSINNGSSYSTYSGAIATTSLAGQTVIIRTSRTATGTGCTASAFKTVTWTVNPRPTGVISGDTAICNGNSTNLSIAVIGTGPWSGTLSDATPFSGNSSPIIISVNPSTTIVYSISTLNDVFCSANASDKTGSATVTVNPLPATPIVTANSSITFCQGESVSLTSSSATDYLWSDGETTRTIAVNYSDVISVTVSDVNGCMATSTNTTVTVTPASLSAFTVTLSTPYNYGFEDATPPQVACGYTVSNYNFPPDVQQWKSSSASAHSGNRHMVIDNNATNGISKDDWFFSAPLNLSAGKLYRASFWYKGSAATHEKFKVYWSTDADVDITMAANHIIYTNNNIQNIAYVNDSATDFIPSITGTYYIAFYSNSAPNNGSLYIDDIQVKEVSTTALVPTSCTTVPNFYNQVFAQPIPGASNYRFEITNGSGFLQVYTRGNSNSDFRLIWAPGVLYGTSYSVRVGYYKNGTWSLYGGACNITTGAFPTIKLRDTTAANCNRVLSSLKTRLFTDTVPGAVDYEYKLVDSSVGYDHQFSRGSYANDYRLQWAHQEAPLTLVEVPQFGHTYNVQVRAKVGTASTGYQQGTFGTTCTVRLSGFPQTQLTSTCGSTLANITDPIYCLTVTGASDYQYAIINIANRSDSSAGYRGGPQNDFRFLWLPAGIKYGTSYDVRVRAKVGGVWGTFGSTCLIITPTAPTTQLLAPACGGTLSTFGQVNSITAVPAATNYRFTIKDAATGGTVYSKQFYRGSSINNFSFGWTKLAGGNAPSNNLQANQTYTVSVAAYAGGSYSAEGPVCNITMPATVRVGSTEASLESAAAVLSLSIFPNPSAQNEEFSLVLGGIQESNEKVNLTIYNMIGAEAYQAVVITKEENRVVIKPETKLAPGVYMVQAQVNDKVIREKFVVK